MIYMASPAILGVALADIFAGCEPWQNVLLGGAPAADGKPAGKAALGAAFRALRDHVAAWGLKSWRRGDSQFVYPYPGNIFAAFRAVAPADLRLVIVGPVAAANSGLALDGNARIGPADKRIWAAAGVLMVGRTLTRSPAVLVGDGAVAVDLAGAAVPHDFWEDYCCGLLARIAAAHPGVPIVTLERMPGVPRAICGDWAEALGRLGPELGAVLSAREPPRRALMFATDGSCLDNGRAGASATWGVYAPPTYAGVANPVACMKRGVVPGTEYRWEDGRGVPGGAAVAPSNNRAEMLAVIWAIEAASEYWRAHPYHGLGLHIVCDSNYTIGTMLSWAWDKAAGDHASVAHNRDLVRVLYRTLIGYAELLRPGCGPGGAREVLFAPWQTLIVPGSGSRDPEPFSWPGITVFIQRSHQRLPAESADWRENLSYERAYANKVADRIAGAT